MDANAALSIDDLRRIEAWTRGYRTLMRGGLGETVHIAGTQQSQLGPDEFAELRVGDVEAMLAALRDEAGWLW